MKPLSLTDEQRRRAVALVVSLTANTPLTPLRYERHLLTRFERGDLTLDQLSEAMDATVYQLLYHSQAVRPMQEADLEAILERSRAYNIEHGITGLLLYSDCRFVQLLEGTNREVERLYAQIQEDARHMNVTTVVEGPGPQLYQHWSMAYGNVSSAELEQTLIAIQVELTTFLSSVQDPHLQKLLQLFV